MYMEERIITSTYNVTLNVVHNTVFKEINPFQSEFRKQELYNLNKEQ